MFVFPLAFRKSLMPALLAPLLLTWPARAAAGPDAERAPTADVVYYGGPIYPLTEDYLHPSTLVPARAHRVDVVAVRNGVIVFTGDRAEAEKAG